jgi:hypothetical protein
MDPYGNTVAPTWKDGKAERYDMPKADKLKKKYMDLRDRVIKWMMCLGYSRRLLPMVQKEMGNCPIWKVRIPFCAADQISNDLAQVLEQIDGLYWEINTLVRIVDPDELPEELSKWVKYRQWYPGTSAGNQAILAEEITNPNKFEKLNYNIAFVFANKYEEDDFYSGFFNTFRTAELEIELEAVDHDHELLQK